jgi:hypothetical protein
VETTLKESNLETGLIFCPDNQFKVLDMSEDVEYLITNLGTLTSIGGEYERFFKIGEFCIDLSTTGNLANPLKRIAITCDPCGGTSGRPCIKTCCPHFMMSQSDEDGSYECVDPPGKQGEIQKYI